MVSFADFNSRGRHNWIIRDLRDARLAGAALERGSTRPLLISTVTPRGHFIGEADETLNLMMANLKDSGRLYRQGNAVVFLTGGVRPGGSCAPTPIVIDGEVTKTAAAIVRNVMMCRETKTNATGKDSNQPLEYDLQFAVPQTVLQQVVAKDGFMAEIPEARYIVNHPVFDKDFHWLDVGYHATQCILVCGSSFEPYLAESTGHRPDVQSVTNVLDALPPLTRETVAGFHWNRPVDLINYIGAALMIPLLPVLVEDGHPGVMFWGNQPGIGKSLAAQILAILKDGQQASPTSVDGGSREVENQIASELNDGRTVLFIDNQKGTLNIPILEANMTAAEFGFRGFHVQRKIRRPNDILWLITTNDAVPSDDLLSRCVHVRLHYEGVPDSHRFALSETELVTHVRDNRAGILAELAGMVTRWLDAGRPSTPADSRFGVFGHVVGSVLACNGLSGFLSNTRQEVREHSTKHQQLVALAERLIDSRPKGFVWAVDAAIESADDEFKRRSPPQAPMEQKDWVPYLVSAGVIPASCDTPQKQKTAVTQYMASVVKNPVEVDVGEHTVRAMIVSRALRSRRTAYMLAVEGLPAIAEAMSDEAACEQDGITPSDTVSSTDAPSPSPDSPCSSPDNTQINHEVGEQGLWDT